MLKQRLITALVGLPGLLLLLSHGPEWAIGLLFLAFVLLSTYEMANMMLPKLASVFGGGAEETKSSRFGILFCVGLGALVFFTSTFTSDVAGLGMLIACVLGSILAGIFISNDNDLAVGQVLGYLVSIAYGVLPWIAMWKLYQLGEGSRLIVLLLAVVWSGDTGAYFGGRFLGKHKLAPRMSPKKTWEGAVAGILASILGGFLANAFWGFSLGDHVVILVASLLGGIVGQMGDLVESTFKRFAGVKDSGNVFPGHGGFLDRCDGLFFAAPLIWFILYVYG